LRSAESRGAGASSARATCRPKTANPPAINWPGTASACQPATPDTKTAVRRCCRAFDAVTATAMTPCGSRPPTIIHRSRGDNYLAPARTQSLPDLPAPAESTAFTLVIGVTPPEALQVRLVSSHRHRAYLRRSSTSPAHSLLHSGPRRGWRDRSLLSCQPWLPRGSRAGLPRCSQGPQGNDSVPGQAQRLDARCRTINSGTS